MSAMRGQIGPIRMHEDPTEAVIRKAAKMAGVSAAAYMRNASEEKANRDIKKALGDERRRGQG